MATLSWGRGIVLLTAAACLAGCSTGEVSSAADDDCPAARDQGSVDCSRPACARTRACMATCGDGVKDSGEQCDDGNTIDGDGCESNCTLPFCGNGIKDPEEACDDGNRVDGDGCESSCVLPACGNGIKDLQEQCDDGNLANGDGCNARCEASAITYLKAFNTRFNALFGFAIALSSDGSTLAVGAIGESSAATGIDGDQTDDSVPFAGAVYVYARRGTMWERQAYIKASNTHTNDEFGMSVALSADGSRLAVGAIGESSAATGIDGDQTDHAAPGSGAVYLFTRSDAAWRQDAYVKASNTDGDDQFGASVALSADGALLAVGAIGEASAATGIGGNQDNNAAAAAGAVYVFTRGDAMWSQQAYVKASNTGGGDSFGWTVALSADGTALAVGAMTEDGGSTGIDGDQSSNAALAAGAVYVFTRSDELWGQQAYIKASNTGRADNFGAALALSADGSTMAVGAPGEDSAATGIGGNQSSNAMLESGAAYVFTRTGPTWSQQAYVKASNTGLTDQFGWSVALSPDGSTLAVGAASEESQATGVGGDQTDNSAFASGAIYRFERSDVTWRQRAYLKASNTDAGDQLGWSLAVLADGTIAASALGESSAATGVGGDQADNSMAAAGAVYVFR